MVTLIDAFHLRVLQLLFLRLVVILLLICVGVSSFTTPSPRFSSKYILSHRLLSQHRLSVNPLNMVGNLSALWNGSKSPSLPKDAKEAVSKCRQAVQEALQKRISRMDIEFPVGTKFGIEKDDNQNKKKRPSSVLQVDEIKEGPTKEDLYKSDRELARIFVEMFQPLGGESICVIFPDNDRVGKAKERWAGDSSASCKITSLTKDKKSSNAKKKKLGFAAKLAEEIETETDSGPFQLPKGCELAIFVTPTPKDMMTIYKICTEVGMSTCVILLNARLTKMTSFGTEDARQMFLNEFQPIFHLAAAPQDEAPGCLLHRTFPTDWILARKPKIGPPKTIEIYHERPTSLECQEAFKNSEGEKLSGVEAVFENIATWFK